MTARLILAIISNLIEETALVVIVLWGLPRLGIHIPLAGLIALMVAWGAFSVTIYRLGSRALRRKPIPGLSAMIGSKGKVLSPLAPQGVIKIKSELWEAKTADRKINAGAEVTVVGQDGLKLTVRKRSADDLRSAE
jgi:membrane-bound serine protease (ClpP class)